MPYYVQNNTPNVQNNPRNEVDEFVLEMEQRLQHDINQVNQENKIINKYKYFKDVIKQNNNCIMYINCYAILEEGKIFNFDPKFKEEEQQNKIYAQNVRKTKAYKYAQIMKTQITRSILNEIFKNVTNKLPSEKLTRDVVEALVEQELEIVPFVNIWKQYEEEEDYDEIINDFITKMSNEDPSANEIKKDSEGN